MRDDRSNPDSTREKAAERFTGKPGPRWARPARPVKSDGGEIHPPTVGTMTGIVTYQSQSERCYFPYHPQTDVEAGKPRFRNVRSKCQCSMCLQFTLIHAVGCVLHRPTSLVIHRLE